MSDKHKNHRAIKPTKLMENQLVDKDLPKQWLNSRDEILDERDKKWICMKNLNY